MFHRTAADIKLGQYTFEEICTVLSTWADYGVLYDICALTLLCT